MKNMRQLALLSSNLSAYNGIKWPKHFKIDRMLTKLSMVGPFIAIGALHLAFILSPLVREESGCAWYVELCSDVIIVHDSSRHRTQRQRHIPFYVSRHGRENERER